MYRKICYMSFTRNEIYMLEKPSINTAQTWYRLRAAVGKREMEIVDTKLNCGFRPANPAHKTHISPIVAGYIYIKSHTLIVY